MSPTKPTSASSAASTASASSSWAAAAARRRWRWLGREPRSSPSTPSTDQIGHARRLSDREEVTVEWHQGDLADLAFVRADTVDVVLSVYALGIVGDLDRVFRQVHRVLRPDGPFVISLPHPAWRATAAGDPPTWRHTYWDRTPRPWTDGGETGADHPLTIADLFGSLTRANFRVDTVLEPEPVAGPPRSTWWQPAMAQIPSTLIVRARKVGT